MLHGNKLLILQSYPYLSDLMTAQKYSPRYLCDSIRRPLSAASGRSLRSLDRHDLLVPRSPTATAQHRAYASVGPMLWNDLPTTIRSVILTGGISASSRCLKTFFSRRALRTWSASDCVLL